MFASHLLLLQIKFVFMFNNTIFLWCTKGRKLPCNIMWFTKFLNSFKIYSPWFSYCNILCLFLVFVLWYLWFFLMKQVWVYIDISSINKTKYQTSPCVCVCVGPHISKWISPNNVMVHVPLSFGNAHWYCFHIKHPSYTMVSW
jgi:hypothetical protein